MTEPKGADLRIRKKKVDSPSAPSATTFNTIFPFFSRSPAIVGAVFAPIAAAALAYAGYKTFEDRYNSPAASNVLIAIAWGASIGGMATPLGGGQAVVTLGLFEKYIGQEIFFLEWTARMLPISLIITAAIALYIYFFMKPETETFAGGDKNFYKKELKKMGPMSYEEKVIGIGFLIILALAVTRPLYVDLIKGPYFKWLHFSPLFFIFASALFIIPSKASKGEYLLSGKIMAQHFPIAIIFIWPAAVALGRILNKTGASKVFAGWLEPLIGAGDVAAISAIALGSNVLSNMTSDTASAGVMTRWSCCGASPTARAPCPPWALRPVHRTQSAFLPSWRGWFDAASCGQT